MCGIDFTSAPRRRKPITVAIADVRSVQHAPRVLHLSLARIERFERFEDWEAWLRTPGPWVAGCDFPFGFARPFVAQQGWPLAGRNAWARTMRAAAALGRPALVERCRAWCDARPAGEKFAHRATDWGAGSSPSMKWVNPPVVLMMHAGAPRLLAAGVDIPPLHRGDPLRVALEVYPAMVARTVLQRASYKSDGDARDDPLRRARRALIADALETGGHGRPVTLCWARAHRDECIADGSGDLLDAVLCCVDAGWALLQRDAGWGLPADIDPIEGWIVGAPRVAR